MAQYRRMFNACKTPGETVDTLNDYFRTGCYLLITLFRLLLSVSRDFLVRRLVAVFSILSL